MALSDADPTGRTAPEPETGAVAAPLRIGLVTDCYVPRLGGIEMQVHDLASTCRRPGTR